MTGLVFLGWCPATTPWTPLAVLPLVFLRLYIGGERLILSACLILVPRYLADEATGEVAFGTYHLRS